MVLLPLQGDKSQENNTQPQREDRTSTKMERVGNTDLPDRQSKKRTFLAREEVACTVLSKDGVNNVSRRRDFISRLPYDVLISIVSRLTLREAVGTSVLSCRWKDIWKFGRPELNFNHANMHFPEEENCSGKCFNFGSGCAKVDQDRFVRGVNQVLASYRGSHVSKFCIKFCLKQSFADAIDEWVRFAAVQYGVESLDLDLACGAHWSNFREDLRADVERNDDDDDRYVFRGEILEGVDSSLKFLALKACNLGPTTPTQFSCLETLLFGLSPLALYDLQRMFSYLVKLKELTFSSCSLPTKLSLASLPQLKSFKLVRCSGIQEIEISNLSLTELQCVPRLPIPLDLGGAPNLEIFGNFVSKVHFPLPSSLQNLRYLRELDVYAATNRFVCIPEIPIFSNVRQLSLNLFENPKFDILKLISILRAFPCLRKLYSAVCPEDYMLEKHSCMDYVHEHLEEVEINCFLGTWKQIDFAIYILKISSALKQLVLVRGLEVRFPCGTLVRHKGQPWEEGEREKLRQHLQEFSKDAVVIIK